MTKPSGSRHFTLDVVGLLPFLHDGDAVSPKAIPEGPDLVGVRRAPKREMEEAGQRDRLLGLLEREREPGASKSMRTPSDMRSGGSASKPK